MGNRQESTKSKDGQVDKPGMRTWPRVHCVAVVTCATENLMLLLLYQTMDYAIILLQLSFVHLKIEASKIPGLKIPIAFSQEFVQKKETKQFCKLSLSDSCILLLLLVCLLSISTKRWHATLIFFYCMKRPPYTILSALMGSATPPCGWTTAIPGWWLSKFEIRTI